MNGPLPQSSVVVLTAAISLLLTACTSGLTHSRPLSVSTLFAPASPALGNVPADAAVGRRLAGVRVPFIANDGQVDEQVAFYAPTFAGTFFVTAQGELVYALPGQTSVTQRGKPRSPSGPGWGLTETLRGGLVRPVGQDRSATGVSYFLGNDPARWRPAVPTYEQVSLGEVWPGVTVSLRARGNSIEKAFTVAPGASVARIRVRAGGADALSVDPLGALVARTGLGPVTFTAPVAYQERDGVHHSIAVSYRLTGREYGFSVGAYEEDLPLVIDPLLQSTYVGGSQTELTGALAIHPTTGMCTWRAIRDPRTSPARPAGRRRRLEETLMRSSLASIAT